MIGLLVYWSIGLLVYWSIGLLVYWSIGLSVLDLLFTDYCLLTTVH